MSKITLENLKSDVSNLTTLLANAVSICHLFKHARQIFDCHSRSSAPRRLESLSHKPMHPLRRCVFMGGCGLLFGLRGFVPFAQGVWAALAATLTVITCAGSTFWSESAQAKPWDKVYTESVGSVAYLFSGGGLCAGTLVEEDLILTAWHCVDTLREIHIGFKDMLEPENLHAKVVAVHPGLDLAALRLNRKVSRPVIAILEKSASVHEGQSIAAIGHPRGIDIMEPTDLSTERSFVLTRGIVSRVTSNQLLSDIPADHGNSGGPILSEEGKLVGVASKRGPSITYSPSRDRILEFLAKVPKETDAKPVSLAMANGGSDFFLFYTQDLYMRRLSGSKTGLWGVGIYMDAFDRLRIAYRETFLLPEKLRVAETGWVFKPEFSPAVHAEIAITGGLHYYKPRAGESYWCPGVSLSVDLPGLPQLVTGLVFTGSKPGMSFGVQL